MTEPKKRTTAKIRDTLIDMLGDTPIESISVTDLCEKAKINRATFYYHYDCVQDVFNEIEKQMEYEFSQFLAKATVTDDGMPEKSFYVTFFEFIAHNAGICRVIINSPHKSSDSFLSRAMVAGRTKVVSVMTALYPTCPTPKIDYYYIFVSHGFLGLLIYWLNNGMRETTEEIAEIGEMVSYRGIQYLK